jgi:hypothetical protein
MKLYYHWHIKVQVWIKFSKKKLWKKVKSPLSMNFGRISTSKCRGKLQKMGVLYTHSLKSPGPSPKLPKILFFKLKNFKKNGNCPTGAGVDTCACGAVPIFLEIFFLPALHFCASGQLLLVGSSTCPRIPNFSLKLQTPITFDL